ncbi:dihydrolipoyl dehydrogenase family protein [Lacisediminihabitans changchengi]|uniref:NAD(P)/FAD-dependent oxidoreductase n=1 Tax=Lacisediminihabitans changchengi TaxID=2787634 RepID=A0A934W218_9MICO|nr:NAD(P)/FAD-dependent oxidoreductase [Lacisediminihabitans changchengi]MBK4347463.1 NAD(P)/FAD-dependent oxidoreductase [Lacisediminihabitans changchengi]
MPPVPVPDTTEFDVIVIGAGAVGENIADRAMQRGLTVLLVESELVGGECSYWACMPSKVLLRSGIVLRAAQAVEGAEEAITGTLDVAATLARRNSFTHDWNDQSQIDWVIGAGVALVRGHARFTGPKVLDVDGTTYTARHAIAVSVGSDPLLPDIPGLADVSPWTSRHATSAQTAPRSLAIIGGGVVSVEMATAYASFGTTITILSRTPLLNTQEPFVSETVTKSLEAAGVSVLVGANTASAKRTDVGVELTLDDGSTVVADEVLVAVGRVPRTMDLGFEAIGLTPGDWLDVDDTMLVKGFDWLYACGDVNHRVLLTHQGKYQARAAGDVIAARALGTPVDDSPFGTHAATADHEMVPQVTFSDPAVASVGLTAAAAEKAGYDIRVIDYDLGWVAGASVQADGYEGHARMIVDEKRKVILGVTFVGKDVAELLHGATTAVVGQVPIDRLWHAVPAYPTINEIWLRLLETYGRP